MKRKAFYLLTLLIVALIMALVSFFIIGLPKKDCIVIFIIAYSAHPIVYYVNKRIG